MKQNQFNPMNRGNCVSVKPNFKIRKKLDTSRRNWRSEENTFQC